MILCISTGQTRSKWQHMIEDLTEPTLIPIHIQERASKFDNVWFDFVELKDRNEYRRKHVSLVTKEHGALKAQAPLPWLLYKLPDGTSGQTRNQENFDKMWGKCVSSEEGLGPPIRFLTVQKSSLAEQARRSRLSNDETRYENLFSPVGSPSKLSLASELPISGYSFPELAIGSKDMGYSPQENEVPLRRIGAHQRQIGCPEEQKRMPEAQSTISPRCLRNVERSKENSRQASSELSTSPLSSSYDRGTRKSASAHVEIVGPRRYLPR